MNILFWTDGFWPRIGGIETQAVQYIQEMRKKGHRFSIVAQKDYPDWKGEDDYEGTPIRRFDFNRLVVAGDLKQFRPISNYLEAVRKEFRPDIVHLNISAVWSAFFFLLFEGAFQAPIVLTVHAPYLFQTGVTPFVTKIPFMVDQICCVSGWVLKELKKWLPAARHKMRLIYNGLEMPSLSPTPLRFSPPTLLLLGRLSSEKGYDVAIRAFCLLKKKGLSCEAAHCRRRT